MLKNHYIVSTKVVKFMETESRLMVVRGWGKKGMNGDCLLGTQFQLCKMKRVLWMEGGEGCTTMCVLNTIKL